MAKQSKRPVEDALRAVTHERAKRLYRLLQLLATGPQSRSALTKRLRLDIRGFYRDLQLLRSAGIELLFEQGKYCLHVTVDQATSRLPFPNPHLTLSEAIQLSKGRSAAHEKLRYQINRIVE